MRDIKLILYNKFTIKLQITTYYGFTQIFLNTFLENNKLTITLRNNHQ
jgi:hypothetical protein